MISSLPGSSKNVRKTLSEGRVLGFPKKGGSGSRKEEVLSFITLSINHGRENQGKKERQGREGSVSLRNVKRNLVLFQTLKSVSKEEHSKPSKQERVVKKIGRKGKTCIHNYM